MPGPAARGQIVPSQTRDPNISLATLFGTRVRTSPHLYCPSRFLLLTHQPISYRKASLAVMQDWYSMIITARGTITSGEMKTDPGIASRRMAWARCPRMVDGEVDQYGDTIRVGARIV